MKISLLQKIEKIYKKKRSVCSKMEITEKIEEMKKNPKYKYLFEMINI